MRTSIKQPILFLIFATFTAAISAQTKKPIPVNELGLITYSEVVQVEGASAETLFNNALAYLQSLVENHKNLKKGPYINEDSTELSLPLAYTVYRDFPIQSPHGKIKYILTVSIKEGRYRYVATNFVFHYLERNRYGRFVEVKGKSKQLEDPVFKGSQKLWDQHQQQTAEKVQKIAEMLAAEMVLPPEGPKEEIVKIDEAW